MTVKGRAPLDLVLEVLIVRLDAVFTAGRVFGLLPVVVLSWRLDSTLDRAEAIAQYQVALLLSTLVLFGGPQTYLVKQGVQRKVFFLHMGLSTILVAAGSVVVSMVAGAPSVVAPFVFLVCYRSYYLLLASYLKFDPPMSLVLLVGAVLSVAVFAATLSYWLAAAVSLATTVAVGWRTGYLRPRFVVLAVRRYLWILKANLGFFLSFTMQQSYTQIGLAVFALFASGVAYLQATHLVYIYSLSFIGHGILFRYFLAGRFARMDRADVTRLLLGSAGLGALSAVVVLVLYGTIEEILFSASLLGGGTAVLLAVMIMLNSSNFAWSVVFLKQRRPLELAALSAVSVVVLVTSLSMLSALDVANAYTIGMLVGLSIQAALRSWRGRQLIENSMASAKDRT